MKNLLYNLIVGYESPKKGEKMKKRVLFIIATIVAFTLFVPSVMAAEKVAKIDETEYTTLAEAVVSATDGDIIVLTSDVSLNADLLIEKELTIDLNGKKISLVNEGNVIKVKGGNLTVTGTGTIEELKPYYAPIMVVGTDDQTVTDYSVLNVEKDVTLKGWAGIFVRQTNNNRGYGIDITFNGNIETLADASDSLGSGIYVNGNIQPKASETLVNYPVITLGKDAVINSVGCGIYAAGYATWNINGATITGVESGLGIKSGKFNITDATITATGEYNIPDGYNNGINESGAAIQIESNNGYAGNIELNIEDGTFVSENGNVIVEYLSKGSKEYDTSDDTTETSVSSIDISGGNFVSEVGVFDLSSEFNAANSGFISGGTFSDGYIPDAYLATAYEYVVIGNGEVVLEEDAVTLTMYFVVNGELVKDEDDQAISFETLFTKGYDFSEEEIKELEEELEILEEDINEMFKEDGYVFLGLFTDKEGKNKVDFSKSLDENIDWYISVGEKVEEKTEELPPKTSDINLVLLIGTIFVGTAGAVITFKKRLARNH